MSVVQKRTYRIIQDEGDCRCFLRIPWLPEDLCEESEADGMDDMADRRYDNVYLQFEDRCFERSIRDGYRLHQKRRKNKKTFNIRDIF